MYLLKIKVNIFWRFTLLFAECFGRFPLPQKASVSVTASLHNSQFTAGVVELQPKGFIDTECSERFGLVSNFLTPLVGVFESEKVSLLKANKKYFFKPNKKYDIVVLHENDEGLTFLPNIFFCCYELYEKLLFLRSCVQVLKFKVTFENIF